jgi:hypothetical protein
MKEARWKVLLRKSIFACVAAIEVYNKPVMPHRDETFAMLAVNAWELMLKARLVREAKNDLSAIQIFVPILTKDGQPTKRRRIERNRAGNPMTISLREAVRRVSNLAKMPLDQACVGNLGSLVEIRDNAVHFMNDDPEMARRTHAVGCACLRNYAAAVGEWFDEDLSKHRFMILPLSFEGAGGPALAIAGRRSRQVANLMAYLDRAADAQPPMYDGLYAAAIQVETRIVGSRVKDATALRFGGGPGAPEVMLTEERIADRWPLDYAALQKRAKARVPGLLFNRAFNIAAAKLKDDNKFAFRRRLHPRDPKCKTFKVFYSDAAVDALAQALAGSAQKKAATAAQSDV